jgi:hypothetical protein
VNIHCRWQLDGWRACKHIRYIALAGEVSGDAQVSERHQGLEVYMMQAMGNLVPAAETAELTTSLSSKPPRGHGEQPRCMPPSQG